MQLLNIQLNKYLLLENFQFAHHSNNIEALNASALQSFDLHEQLSLLTIATNLVEKFHSFFHFEQSFFHLQLAICYLSDKEYEQAKAQLELAIFQDHVNQQAIDLLNNIQNSATYKRPYNKFSQYLSFATNEHIDGDPRNESYWDDWKKEQDKESLKQIIEKIRYLHLNYHQESAKLYLNRALVFYKLEQYSLAKNDVVKASNLDSKLKDTEYYSIIISQMTTEVVLGLGSNLGDRLSYLQKAINKLKELNILYNVTLSSIEETKAFLKPGSPSEWNLSFLNMAIKGYTTLSPLDLIKALKDIEYSLGRTKTELWAPREIDIDILAYGNFIIEQDDLIIPHPELCNRPWALKPFVEIYPEWRYPVQGPYYNLSIKDIDEKN